MAPLPANPPVLPPALLAAPAQVGLRVRELQEKLPKARVVYCSATGASGEHGLPRRFALPATGPRLH